MNITNACQKGGFIACSKNHGHDGDCVPRSIDLAVKTRVPFAQSTSSEVVGGYRVFLQGGRLMIIPPRGGLPVDFEKALENIDTLDAKLREANRLVVRLRDRVMKRDDLMEKVEAHLAAENIEAVK